MGKTGQGEQESVNVCCRDMGDGYMSNKNSLNCALKICAFYCMYIN